ncbi:MAG: T9SS type A sorting domain-containing protein [Aliifodinibius sp.]|nr:T9SS type A sorting domain-containing protein [Fodinibius sp.]NIY29232.1 T9SS type A sorting domain-containing protein [Fodinibius sp.]
MAVFIMLSIIENAVLMAQDLRIVWEREYQSQDSTAFVNQAIFDDVGNIYLAGYSQNDQNSEDFITLKYDADGNQEWIARYNGPGNSTDKPIGVSVDRQGNPYIVGQSIGLNSDFDFVVIKYDHNGFEKWDARFDGPLHGADVPTAFLVNNQNTYVPGRSLGPDSTLDCITIKYNSDGVEQWSANYAGRRTGLDQPYALAMDHLQNVYIAGESSDETDTLATNFVIVKYDNSGNELWDLRYRNEIYHRHRALKMIVDDSLNIYVSGEIVRYGSARDNAAATQTLKYNAKRQIQWIGSDANDSGTDVPGSRPINFVMDSLGNLVFSAVLVEFGQYFYRIVKRANDGKFLWENHLKPDRDVGDLLVDSSGKIYVAQQNVLMAFSPEGAILWEVPFEGDYFYISDLEFSQNETEILIAGNLYDTQGNSSIKLIKTKLSPVMEPGDNTIRSKLHQNSPNPFMNSTQIYYDVAQTSRVVLEVYDILGRKISTLVDEVKEKGRYDVTLNIPFSSGVYFSVLKTTPMEAQFKQTEIQARKMVLIN